MGEEEWEEAELGVSSRSQAIHRASELGLLVD